MRWLIINEYRPGAIPTDTVDQWQILQERPATVNRSGVCAGEGGWKDVAVQIVKERK